MSVEDLLLGWADLEEAVPDYLEAQAYAEGEVDEVFSSTGEIAQKLAKASRAYRFPFISVPITARVNRCKINTIKADNDAGTDWIETAWDANDMDVWYPELFWKTFMFGDAYIMVWEIDPEEDGISPDSESPVDQELLAAKVEFTVHSPLNGRMMYDPKNARRKAFFLQRWQVKGEANEPTIYRVDLWYPDRIERYISVKDGDLARTESWEPYEEADEGGAVEPHEYGEVPWFHHRTSLPYGKPVHKRGYGAQNAITKMLATQLDTSDSAGWKQRYRLLDPDAELDQNNDGPQYLDDQDASAFSPGGIKAHGGSDTNLRSGPATMQTFPGTKEVGEFDASEPAIFTEPAVLYMKALAVLTDTSAYLFFPEETPMGQAPSGAALQRADAPLNSSVQRLQTLQKGALREEWRFAGRVAGVKLDVLDIQWEPIERATSKEDWEVVGLKQQYGVPVDQTLTEAGYTEEQATDWREEQEAKEQEAMDQMAEALAQPTDPAVPGQPKPPAKKAVAKKVPAKKAAPRPRALR